MISLQISSYISISKYKKSVNSRLVWPGTIGPAELESVRVAPSSLR